MKIEDYLKEYQDDPTNGREWVELRHIVKDVALDLFIKEIVESGLPEVFFKPMLDLYAKWIAWKSLEYYIAYMMSDDKDAGHAFWTKSRMFDAQKQAKYEVGQILIGMRNEAKEEKCKCQEK